MSFNKGIMGLLVSLYPMGDTYREVLTQDQQVHFNRALKALNERLRLASINVDLLDLHFDGVIQPFPFPDLHWEIVTCWLLIDGTLPPPILLKDNTTIDYYSIIQHDPPLLTRWKRRLEYAKTGFRLR